MNPFEIMQNLKEEEIDEYIKHRLSFLKNKEETVLGLHTDNVIFSGLLDEKTPIRISIKEKDKQEGNDELIFLSFSNLVFDDDEIYKYLIRSIKNTDNPYDAVIEACTEYLSLHDKERADYKRLLDIRSLFYDFFSIGRNKPLSIKTFHKYKFAYCSEIAGVIHNMFKFLGIESDYVVGSFIPNGNPDKGGIHAFNIVYFWGRDKEGLLIDATKGYDEIPDLCLLGGKEKDSLLPYGTLEIDETDIINAYDMALGLNVQCEKSHNKYSIYNELFIEIEDYEEIPSEDKNFPLYKKLTKKNKNDI
jgi:hypothetical protein